MLRAEVDREVAQSGRQEFLAPASHTTGHPFRDQAVPPRGVNDPS